MNIFDLPAYVETDELFAYRDSFAHRYYKVPYINYYVYTRRASFEFAAKWNTDLLAFEKPLKRLGAETFNDLAELIASKGYAGVFRGCYVLEKGEFTAILELVENGKLSFTFVLSSDELMLSVTPSATISEFFYLLRRLARKEKERDV